MNQSEAIERAKREGTYYEAANWSEIERIRFQRASVVVVNGRVVKNRWGES